MPFSQNRTSKSCLPVIDKAYSLWSKRLLIFAYEQSGPFCFKKI